jgi:hypothetical protein
VNELKAEHCSNDFLNWYNNTGEEGEVDTELRDSLLPGRTGKFAQVQSSWEVLPDGMRRFLSAIIYGKGIGLRRA